MTQHNPQYRLVHLPPEQRISPAQLKEKIAKDKMYIVDVRSPNEIKDMIKGHENVNIPISDIESSLKLGSEEFRAKYGKDKPPVDGSNVVFHCAKGARGSIATEIAVKLGFLKAQNLDGGYTSFVEK